MIPHWSLFFGLLLSLIDCGMMSTLKLISIGTLSLSWKSLVFPVVFYAMTPLIFLYAMQHESMTVMNLLWDVISSVLVTGIGLYYFNEKITHTKMIGVFFSFVAIYLLSLDE